MSPTNQPADDLARFFELSPDLFCIANLDGYFLRVNGNFSRVLGYPEPFLLSRPFLDFVHPDDLAATRRVMACLADGELVADFRNRYRAHDGVYHCLEWTARPVDGAIYAVARDVSKRVALEERILRQEARERALLDHTTAVVYVKAIDGRYQFVNQRYLEVFRLRREDVLDKRDDEIFPPAEAAAFMANDREVLESREQRTLREVAPHPDGPHVYVSVKMPLFDAAGEPVALAGISTDITDQVHAQEAAQQLALARVFQQRLYPPTAPAVPGLDVAGTAAPVAPVCGDYYDYLRTGPRALVAAVGDVSGHGFASALQMVEVRTALRTYLRETGSLARAALELNRLLCDDLPTGSFVTLFLAQIDAARGEATYLGAGHLAYLVRANGDVEELWSTSPLLGVYPDSDYAVVTVPFGPGDLLLLFTDGLNETANPAGETFGTRRVQETIRRHRRQPARVVVEKVFAALYKFAAGRPIEDDITAIVVKRTV